jgi:hypothetical protein
MDISNFILNPKRLAVMQMKKASPFIATWPLLMSPANTNLQ